MSRTRSTIFMFRFIVLVALVAMIYFSRTHQRYLFWASIVALLLAICAVPSQGEVIRREPTGTDTDALLRAMNGPHGLRVRLGLVILFILLVLLGSGVLEPGRLAQT